MANVAVHSPPEKIVEIQLDEKIQAIEDIMTANVVAYVGSLLSGLETVFRDQVEAVASSAEKKEKMVVVLETDGGYIEVVQRIAETLRHHYSRVEFVVPNFAMSAGTVLVMSGDAIHMDYFSILGPIDPQVGHENGRQVPALGYLAQYKKLIEKADQGKLNTAELTILVEKFDQAELYKYEEARKLSISLLQEWLVKYKFKDWKKTQETGRRVTNQLRKSRATMIARKLSDPDHWHSHGRGISMDVLSRDVNLRIEDFGKNNELRDRIRVYCKLLGDYMLRLGHVAVLHRRGSYVPLIQE